MDNDLYKPFSVREHIDVLGWNRLTWIMFCSCGIYWLCDAIEVGLLSYLVPVLEEQWNLAPSLSDSIAAIVFAGIAIGGIVFGPLSDRFGRRLLFGITAAGTGVFGMASAFAPEIVSMLILRFCCGLFLGGAPMAYSMYFEFIPSKHVWVMAFFQLWFTVGSIFEALIAFGVLTNLGYQVILNHWLSPMHIYLISIFVFSI